MNYHHAFHAGNFADVHKHVVVVALLRHLLGKPKPFFYLDTHAGAGLYDLGSPEAQRSGEWSEGIGRLQAVSAGSPELRDYLDLLRAWRIDAPAGGRPGYPGSPLLALALRRPQDRCVLVEQNADTCASLRRCVGPRRNVSVSSSDGYAAIRAHLPPRENRGLVLIDPPYESADEIDRLVAALSSGYARWSNGMFCIWYPITSEGAHQWLTSRIAASGLRRILLTVLCVRPDDSPAGLNGSGLLVVNPPWRLDERMRACLPELHGLLVPARSGRVAVEWLVPE